MKTDADTLNIPGLRMTKQRKEVYRVLMENRDHPTAAEVYERVKKTTPGISLATVYNCLETLVEHHAVRQVNFERESSRYCPNLKEHGHFHDESTGAILDVQFKKGVQLSDFLDLPEGCQINNLDITLRGTLPQN
jgi:Fur family peroxide stress response transcriptional regulator